jgi:predicted permease
VLRRLTTLLSRLGFVWARRRLDDEARREVAQHIELLTERYVRSGMEPEAAAIAARHQFGNSAIVREHLYEMNGIRWMDALAGDLRHALRQVRHAPAFTSVVVTTLALGIGGTTAVFAVVNAVLVRALPFASPGELVWLASVRQDNPSAPFTLPEFIDYRSRTRTLSGLAAYANWSATMAGDGVPERLQAARMSANAFDVLGATPAAGRLLRESDDRSDAPRVAVISYRLWQRRFGGTPAIAGTTARINGEAFAIVGVLPRQFPWPLRDIDVVVPLVPDRDPLRHLRGSVNFLRYFGRLSPGTDAASAQAELTAICGSLREQFPQEYARKQAVRVTPLQEALVGDFRQSMLLLLGAVIVVLAAALANLVSLALVRANERRAELSVRVALGASRWHIARQLTVEAAMLAVSGAGAGWVLSVWAIAAVLPWAPASVPRLDEVETDRTVALFAMAITVVAAAFLATAPLIVAAKARASQVLTLASRGSIGDRWSHGIRHALVVAEISTALVLLLATIALIQNLLGLHGADPGFRPDGVFQARVTLPPAYRSPDDVARFSDRLSERLLAAPGVTHAGLISVAPLSGLLATVPFTIADEPPRDRRDTPMANLRAITPGYIPAVGTRLLSGRMFAESDRRDTPAVALVSDALARRFLSGNVLGRRLLIDDNNSGPRPVEIVGVVDNVRHTALDAPAGLDIYLALRQIHADATGLLRNNQFWMVRSASDPGAFGLTFVAQLRAVEPDAAISTAGPMREQVDAWLGPRRFNLGLFVAFAMTAVLLAVTGLYGLVSYAVSQRAAEIGLRMALGATEQNVRRMILAQAAGLGVAGAVVGLALAVSVRRFLPGVTRDVWLDMPIVAVTAAALVAIVVLAAWLPSRRAARISPTLALRGV